MDVSFYELLTGQLPFPTTDVLELVRNIPYSAIANAFAEWRC
ncbi:MULTISPECIES: hypothetical protein [unclassified Fischerella]|nr:MULTISPECIES: hypothetical protein [unclassified Fischerella]